MEQTEKQHGSPADYLAAERTFLAWIRTGLALMALGFVLARFGLFLQEFNAVRPDLPIASYHYSLWFGTILILVGVAVSLLALSRYLRLLAMIRTGERTFDRPSTLAIGIAIFLAMMGLVLSYYLIASRHL
jgi:putative membrane protein